MILVVKDRSVRCHLHEGQLVAMGPRREALVSRTRKLAVVVVDSSQTRCASTWDTISKNPRTLNVRKTLVTSMGSKTLIDSSTECRRTKTNARNQYRCREVVKDLIKGISKTMKVKIKSLFKL